jgi:tellurite resistance-related uncharacterized protein
LAIFWAERCFLVDNEKSAAFPAGIVEHWSTRLAYWSRLQIVKAH